MEILKINSNFVFSFLDFVPLSILCLNEDLTIFFANNYFCKVLHLSQTSLNGLFFSDLSEFDMKNYLTNKDNFDKYHQIELSLKSTKKSFLFLVSQLTITLNEKDEKDLYVVIFQDPFIDELDPTKFQEWIKSSRSNISLIVYIFESGTGPIPLFVINESIFKGTKDPASFIISKMGLHFMTAIGQGLTHSTGLFGPLPVPGDEFESFNSVVYALRINDRNQTDPRTQGTRYTLVTLVYPKIYERFLLNRRRIRSIIWDHFQIDDISQLNHDLVNKTYHDLLFSNTRNNTSGQITERNNNQNRRNLQLLESKINEITDLHNRIHDIYDLDSAMDEITITIEKCIDFKLLAIFGVDKFNNELFVLKTRGYYDYKVKNIRIEISNKKSVVTKAAQTLKTVLVPDVTKIDYFFQVDSSIKSDLAVPIKIKDELLGAIILESDIKDIFSQDDVTLLELVSEIAATIINQHRNEMINHDLNVLMNRLTNIEDIDEALEEITRFAEILLNFEIFCILDTRKEDVKFLSYRGYGNKNELPKFKRTDKNYFVCHAYMNKESIYVDDLHSEENIPYYKVNKKVSSEYCIPLIIKGEVLGIVNVESTRPLDRHELVIFETLANYTKLMFKNYFK